MTCREVTDALHDYLSGELPPERREELEGHVSGCTDCTNYLAAYRQALSHAREAFDSHDPQSAEIPDALVKAIIAARRPS